MMLGYTQTVLDSRKAEVASIMHGIAIVRHQTHMSKAHPPIGYKVPVAPAPLATESKLTPVTKAATIKTARKPKAAQAPEPEVQTNGVWATHAKFGSGLIISEGDGKITIRFADNNVRTLIAALAKLVR